jgi:hypothetical protein
VTWKRDGKRRLAPRDLGDATSGGPEHHHRGCVGWLCLYRGAPRAATEQRGEEQQREPPPHHGRSLSRRGTHRRSRDRTETHSSEGCAEAWLRGCRSSRRSRPAGQGAGLLRSPNRG